MPPGTRELHISNITLVILYLLPLFIMANYHEQLLRLKLYGQPYMPTDMTQLAYALDLQSRRLWAEFKNWAFNYYFAPHNSPWGPLALFRDAIVAYTVILMLRKLFRQLYGVGIVASIHEFVQAIARRVVGVVMALPPIRNKIEKELDSTIEMMEHQIVKNDEALLQFPKLPPSGIPSEIVVGEIEKLQEILAHSDWESGRVSGAVYHGGEELLDLQLKAYHMYSVANQLHPDIFPGIRKMEAEVVAMVLKLFNAPELGCGATTSGGTESLLLTGLAAREYARKYRGVREPEVIAPVTVHAGIEKACTYFNMKLHKVELDPKTFQVDVKKVKRLINSNTVLLVGSAPNYPHGIIDDIEALSKLAVRYDIPLHVDACLGSFIVSFLEKSNVHDDRVIPIFDFRAPGVTSISCDTHKYGFAPKGSSIIMYRNSKLRECQYYILSNWTGGMYGSPTLAGSRPGALMAGCWATMLNIGESGYSKSCYDIVSATMKAKEAIKTHALLSKHLEILGDPIASVIAFRTRPKSNLNIYVIGDAMTKKGWHLASLQRPAALHFAFTRLTVPVVDTMIGDLVEIVDEQKDSAEKPKSDTAALYGVAGSISTAGVANEIIAAYLDLLYKL